MIIIQYHDLTRAEYAAAIITSVTGGSTWMTIPSIYGDKFVSFVAAETPREIIEFFAANPDKTIRVEVSWSRPF